jgi:hypothetical protein
VTIRFVTATALTTLWQQHRHSRTEPARQIGAASPNPRAFVLLTIFFKLVLIAHSSLLLDRAVLSFPSRHYRRGKSQKRSTSIPFPECHEPYGPPS